MKYHPHIDGLRALAIVPVVLFHVGLGCGGGYIGVDVFFVISGYLITALILKEIGRGGFSIVGFWERRIRRILPALAVVVAACLLAGWFLFLPENYEQLGRSAVAQAFLISNVHFWREAGYFAEAAEVKPLLHTWSLAVEEQFYLLFPFLLLSLKAFRRRALLLSIAMLGIGSLGLSIYQTHQFPTAAFYLLPSRMWELCLGAFLAASPPIPADRRLLRECLSWAGLLLIFLPIFLYSSDTRFPGLAAIPPCAGAAAVIAGSVPGLTSSGRLLALRPVVFIGLISYSLYLWHWPVLVFSRYWALEPEAPSSSFFMLLGSAVAGVLSWRFIETPFRKRTVFGRTRHIFLFAAVAAAITILAGYGIAARDGIPARMPSRALAYLASASPREFVNELTVEDARSGRFVELGNSGPDAPIQIFVWGDSHAMAAMPVFDRLCRDSGVRGAAATHSSTAPLLDYESNGEFSLRAESTAFNAATAAFIQRIRPHDVFLIAAWMGYDREPEKFRRGLKTTVDAIEKSGARVWIVKQVPMQRFDVPKGLASTVIFGGDPAQIGLPLQKLRKKDIRQDKFFKPLASERVEILDPVPLLVGPNGRTRLQVDGRALFRDNHHLTKSGALELRPLFEPIFKEIVRARK